MDKKTFIEQGIPTAVFPALGRFLGFLKSK